MSRVQVPSPAPVRAWRLGWPLGLVGALALAGGGNALWSALGAFFALGAGRWGDAVAPRDTPPPRPPQRPKPRLSWHGGLHSSTGRERTGADSSGLERVC